MTYTFKASCITVFMYTMIESWDRSSIFNWPSTFDRTIQCQCMEPTNNWVEAPSHPRLVRWLCVWWRRLDDGWMAGWFGWSVGGRTPSATIYSWFDWHTHAHTHVMCHEYSGAADAVCPFGDEPNEMMLLQCTWLRTSSSSSTFVRSTLVPAEAEVFIRSFCLCFLLNAPLDHETKRDPTRTTSLALIK